MSFTFHDLKNLFKATVTAHILHRSSVYVNNEPDMAKGRVYKDVLKLCVRNLI